MITTARPTTKNESNIDSTEQLSIWAAYLVNSLDEGRSGESLSGRRCVQGRKYKKTDVDGEQEGTEMNKPVRNVYIHTYSVHIQNRLGKDLLSKASGQVEPTMTIIREAVYRSIYLAIQRWIKLSVNSTVMLFILAVAFKYDQVLTFFAYANGCQLCLK